jgi:hypothetical protein
LVLMAPSPVASLYRVEVSGWDDEENFFVEKTELEWDEGIGKCLRLSRPLRRSSIVFVRLLQPFSPSRGYPIPYQAEPSSSLAEAPGYEYKLTQLHPRISSRRESHA